MINNLVNNALQEYDDIKEAIKHPENFISDYKYA